jgi:hypothetical protein
MKISAAVIALSKIARLAQAKQPKLSATLVETRGQRRRGLWITTASASWRVAPVAGDYVAYAIGAGG